VSPSQVKDDARRRAEFSQAQESPDPLRDPLLSFVVGATNIGTMMWAEPFDQVSVNDHWALQRGFDPIAVRALSRSGWRALVHPEDYAHYRTMLLQMQSASFDYFEIESRQRHRDGRWLWFREHWRVLRRADADQTAEMFAVSTDITASRQWVETSRQTASLIERIGRVAGVGGWELDLRTMAPYWSDETYRIHGLDPSQDALSVEAGIEALAEWCRPVMQAAIEHCMETGEGWDLEVELLNPDGENKWVRAVGALEYEDGDPVRLIGSMQDISSIVSVRRRIERLSHRAALAIDSSGIGIWELQADGQTLHLDGRMRELLGWHDGREKATCCLRCLLEQVVECEREFVAAAFKAGVAGHSHLDVECRFLRSYDGQRVAILHLHFTAMPEFTSDGRVERLVGTAADVTRERVLTTKLAEQHELLRVTLQSIADAVITTDASGHISWMNPVAERLTGWTADEAQGRATRDVFQVIDQDSGDTLPCPVAACLAAHQETTIERNAVLQSRDGSEYGIQDSVSPILDEDDRMHGAVLVFRDVTEQRQMVREMSYRACHDAMTGLINRREFEDRLVGMLEQAHSDGGHRALLFVDLDQFKLVNDSCGHSVGDMLLRQVASLLQNVVRPGDTVARLGGDEFGVLLEHCEPVKAEAIAQRICERMDDFRFEHEGRRFRVSCSVGLVPVDARWPSAGTILQAADASCIAAKESGRNRVQVWFDTDESMRLRRQEVGWTARIEAALDEDRFVLYAQPFLPLQNGSAAECGYHAELLLRLLDEAGDIVLPGAFLPAAERFNLIPRIDRWVLQHALSWLRAAVDRSAIASLGVNLSGRSVGDRAFHRWALSQLAAAGPEICQNLCLEITETAAVTCIADAAAFIEQLHGLGVRVALDDFGEGASSFGYLKHLAVDCLKIDGQFVRDVIDDPLDSASVRCFVDIARVVGVRTVAECVESADVLDRLRELGVDYAQGFHVARPMPLDALLEWRPAPAQVV